MNAQTPTVRGGPIVVGVDETALAGQAVRWAAEQAAFEARDVLLVHAMRVPPSPWSVHPMGPVYALADVRPAGQAMLDRARDMVRSVAPDVRVDEVLELDSPTALLLKHSQRARMVVLGSHGRGPTLSHLLGSVGVGLVRHAPCPVVVHRPGHPGRVRDGVVAAVEASADAIPVLEAAFGQASLRGLPLRVVHHVFDSSFVTAGVPMVVEPPDRGEQDAVDLAEAMAGLRERYPDVRVVVERPVGVPERELAHESARADLLVIGTHQKELAERMLVGSVAVAILERATCPVEVVPILGRPQ